MCHHGDPKAKVCGEGVSSVRVRPNWTVPVGHLAGRHSAVDHWILCMRASAPSLQWSLLIPVCCGGGTGHEVEPYPLTVYKLHLFVAWSPTEFVHLSAANKDHSKLGFLWTVVVDWVLRAGEHEVEPSPISFRAGS